jgi:hypothetical protein
MTIKEARLILAKEADGLTENDLTDIIEWLNNFADIIIDSVENE